MAKLQWNSAGPGYMPLNECQGLGAAWAYLPPLKRKTYSSVDFVPAPSPEPLIIFWYTCGFLCSLPDRACLRWDNDAVGFSIAVPSVPRISVSREEAAEIQRQACWLWSLWETAWLLTAPSVPSQLCLASKAGFIPRAALVIWQWLLLASVFQRRWYSLQLHSHKVSLLTHTKR